MIQNSKLFVAGVVSALFSSAGFAATQGNPGKSPGGSTGSSDVTVNVPSLIRVDGLADMPLGEYSGTGTLNGSTPVCVLTNSASAYTVELSDGTVGDGFNLAAQNVSDSIAMTVTYTDGTTSVNSGATLADGTATTEAFAPHSNQGVDPTLCSSGTVAGQLSVDISEAELQNALADDYAATLTVTVVQQ